LPLQTPASLLDRAQTRWTAIVASQPDLAPAIELQRALVTRAIHTVDRLAELEPPAVSLRHEQVTEKLSAGTPAMRGEPVALPVAMLGPLIFEACDDLAAGGAGDVARRVRGCLAEGRIDIGSLLAASFDRNQTAILSKAVHESVAPDVHWLAAELAVGPAAFVAQRALFNTSTADALAAWPHGYCPACGSWPAFGEDPDEARRLRCSFCGIGWHRHDPACLYCGGEQGQLTTLKTDPGQAHRADLCSECGAYLKWLALPEATPFELLPIEDLASAPLDGLAVQRGFGRPSLPDIGVPQRFPCQMAEVPK